MGCKREVRPLTAGLDGSAATRFHLFAAIFVAVAIFGLSIVVYSPLHKDDPISTSPCPFCQFQHLSAEPAAAVAAVIVSTLVFWFLTITPPFVRWTAHPRTRFGRAPPSSLLAV